MGKKTIWAICAFNIAASASAIAWVTRPYWQPKPKSAFQSIKAAEPKDPEAAWSEFASANSYDAARRAIATTHPGPERQARLAEFLGVRREHAQFSGASLAATRRAAALAFWGEAIETGSNDDAWLRDLTLDRSRSSLEREAALRAVMLAAQRRHKANTEDNTDGWRESLAAYLEKNDFGRGSSVEGLALQARVFALTEHIAPIDRGALIECINLLLQPKNGAAESVTVSALEVARQLQAKELLETIRMVARNPRSDVCQQTALSFLSEHGSEDDLSWISEYIPTNSQLQLTASNARAMLESRLAALKSAEANLSTEPKAN